MQKDYLKIKFTMQQNRLISIIMNCHNGQRYLKNCLKSIFNQTYKNWEIIFWDNVSTDDSKKILNQFKDKRIKYYKSKKFISLYKARNLAIAKAKGDYISFLDTDDLWKKNKLFEQVKILQKNKKINIIYSNYDLKNENNNKRYLKFNKKLPSGYITQSLFNDYSIGILTVILKKKLFKKLKFNSSYSIIGDFDFFIKASTSNEILCIQKPLAVYRVHKNNLSSKKLDLYLSELKKWIKENNGRIKFKKYSFKGIKKLLLKLKIKIFFSKFFGVKLGV